MLAALDVSATAYAPYSGFAVGASVRSASGAIHRGSNLENASYGLGICAEVSVIAAARSVADLDLVAIAVAGHKFSSPSNAEQIVTPCGRCRQVIFEASQIGGHDIAVYCCSGDLQRIETIHISDLLPLAFGPGNLGLDRAWSAMAGVLAGAVAKLRDAAGPGHDDPDPCGDATVTG